MATNTQETTEIESTAALAEGETHAEVSEAGHEEPTGALGTLGINGTFLIAQFVNFLIVVIVLWRFAYKPVVKMLDERSERIERSLKDAENVEKRVASLEKERSEVIAEAKAEAAKVLEDARAQAEERRNESVAKAKEEVQGVVAAGKQQLQAEKEAMIREAKADIAELAVEAARRVLKEGVDEKTSRKVAEQAIEKLS